MKKPIIILLLLLFSMVYFMGLLTQRPPLPFSKDFFSVETPPSDGQPLDLKTVWPVRGKNGEGNEFLLSTQELDKIYELQLDRGIRNYPLLSSVLVREAERAREKGKIDRAVEFASYAVKFAPELSQPYFELAKVRWSQNPLKPYEAISGFLKGISAYFRYYPSALHFFYGLFYLVSNAMLMTFIVFGIVVLIKYLPLYFYDIQKSLTQEIGKLLINSFKILFLFIPFFLRLDMLWALLFWSILLWGYISNKERQWVVLFLVVLIYLPFFLRSSATFLNGSSSDIILEMHRANHEDWDRDLEQRLQAWLVTQPEDPDTLFTLGLIEKRRGNSAQAEKWYQRAIAQSPQFSEAYSNLGNVYLAGKETNAALTSYQKAVDLDPMKAAYHYNLSRAYTEEAFLSGKKDQAFQRARQLDPQLIDYYVAIDTFHGTPHINRFVIDEALSSERLWERFLTHFVGKEGWMFRLFHAWFEKIPSRLSFLAPVLFLLFLIGMSRTSRAKRFLTRCPMCGSPTHRFYLGASDHEFICFNCYRIFVQKEKLHPKIVEKKSLQVRDFQKQNHRISRFVSFFFVGFAYLWRESFFRGLLFLFVFFVFVLRFIYWNGILPLRSTPTSQGIWSLLLWGGGFIIFYLLVLRQTFRMKLQLRKESAGE
jgi:tetratricopeptide (TPR) repeat protein